MKTKKFLLLSLFVLSFLGLNAQEYALSSPFGYGSSTTGGTGGSVTVVTTKSAFETAVNASGKKNHYC